jgi:predicted ester cyclase
LFAEKELLMSTTEENKAIVTSFLKDALEGGKVDLIDSIYAPDGSDPNMLSLEGWKANTLWFQRACPGFTVTILDMMAEGERVMVNLRADIVYSNPAESAPAWFPPLGKPVSWRNMHVFHIVGGKIVSENSVSGWTDMLVKTGVVPLDQISSNKAAVRKFVDGLNNRDAALLTEVCSPELAKDWIDSLPGLYATMKDHHIELSEIIADGDAVAVKMATSGYHTGELFGLAPTGKWWTNRGQCFFRFSAGKIAEVDPLFDAENHFKQLGGFVRSALDAAAMETKS